MLLNAFVWASSPQEPVAVSVNPVKEATSDRKAPAESHKSIVSADGIAVDLVVSEPVIAQPSFIDFDERGRMWVVQYRQYPFPAGLEVKDKDRFWRTKYTGTPEPPGRAGYIPGKDMITIHEDGDGDGVFEHSKPFLEGLNMVTSFAWDADGVWVLQPPYLLFYYDRDKDDVPDGPPDVHLSGFGLEDTHSTVNSLTWGPDGWLYGRGIYRDGICKRDWQERTPIKSIGQLMGATTLGRTYMKFSLKVGETFGAVNSTRKDACWRGPMKGGSSAITICKALTVARISESMETFLTTTHSVTLPVSRRRDRRE